MHSLPQQKSTGLRQRGITLVEMMITMVVFAILLAIAMPSFESAIASGRVAGSTNDLMSALAQARSEAIRRGQRVTVCISADGAQCLANGTWQQGWITFIDTTRAGNSANVDAGEIILRANPAQPPSIPIQGNANLAQYVSFGANGQALLMNGNSQSGVIRVCSTSSALTDNDRTRDISLSMAGLVTRQTTAGVDETCPAP